MSVAVVFKSPYAKGGKAAGKAGYIARRIGVDKSINNRIVINANLNYSQVSSHKNAHFLGEQAILSAPNIKLPLHLV